jgi:DNA-binding CsgD family transcriptional regulator
MSTDDVLDRLGDRFFALTRSRRATEPRHRTLRATMDWSHDTLTREEQILFRRLSIFAGGWTLEDAEAVCFDEVLPRDGIMDLQARLAEKSLVVAEPPLAGPTRFRFLETIRQYAAERLSDADEAAAVRARHFEHFLSLAETYHHRRMNGGSDAGLAALAAHRDNFRAALAWSVEEDSDGCLRLTAALDDFWRMVSASEGWGWLQRTLPPTPADSPYRLGALLTAGMLSAYVPAYAEGAGLLREAVYAARWKGDPTSEAWAELWLGRLSFFGEDLQDAEQHLHRALAAHQELGNPLGQVRSLALLGLLEGLVLGRLAEGEEKLQRALELAHQIGDGWGEGYAHLMLGLTAGDAGDLDRAADHSRAALAAPSLGPILGVPIQGMARVAVARDPGRAMRLLGAASGHFERTGTLEPPFVRRRADATRQQAEDLLGAGAAARLFQEGRRMSTEEAIAYALSEEAAVRSPGGLTPREMQVAALVARGRTNRHIATALFISVRTVESHVDHILTKLGLANRTQLAAWAADHELPLENP